MHLSPGKKVEGVFRKGIFTEVNGIRWVRGIIFRAINKPVVGNTQPDMAFMFVEIIDHYWYFGVIYIYAIFFNNHKGIGRRLAHYIAF